MNHRKEYQGEPLEMEADAEAEETEEDMQVGPLPPYCDMTCHHCCIAVPHTILGPLQLSWGRSILSAL